jgi:hypothetical protein
MWACASNIFVSTLLRPHNRGSLKHHASRRSGNAARCQHARRAFARTLACDLTPLATLVALLATIPPVIVLESSPGTVPIPAVVSSAEVVGFDPVGAGIRRTRPIAVVPEPASILPVPISFDPLVVEARSDRYSVRARLRRRSYLNANSKSRTPRRRTADQCRGEHQKRQWSSHVCRRCKSGAPFSMTTDARSARHGLQGIVVSLKCADAADARRRPSWPHGRVGSRLP